MSLVIQFGGLGLLGDAVVLGTKSTSVQGILGSQAVLIQLSETWTALPRYW
jgi:hypothetical protein